MANEKQLLKALETVSLGFSLGTVSADILIKACENYKNSISFDDGIDYQILVSKSLFDSLNNIEVDAEIAKAILPGQTKVIDGVMYIYSATAPGSKQPYGWHVVKKGAKTGKAIGHGNKLTNEETDEAQKFINELFPKDLSTLKTVNTSIGGSTGAKLVQDVNGNQYILKRNPKNSGHVRSEYLTNQLYDLLGIKVPDYELYDDDEGVAVLLSKFIPMCKPANKANPKQAKQMADGFIVDCLLNNWDVYENDNCLVDPAGRVIRVDNGGALNYRAQGGSKPFNDDILKSFNGMVSNNPTVYSALTPADIKKQIDDITKRKDDIVNFLKESGQDSLADIIAKRIDGMPKILGQLQRIEDIANMPVAPRNLKSAEEMYRDLTEDELKDLWENQKGNDAYSKMSHKNDNGWELLGKICHLRGFDARPQVVSDDEYWKLIAKDDSRHFFRGIGECSDHTLTEMACSMLFENECFYGTIGAYGEGIYVARQEGAKIDQSGYQNTWGFTEARSYAHRSGGRGIVMRGIVSPDAKYVKFDDLRKEIDKMSIPSGNSQEIQDLQDELDSLGAAISNTEDQIQNAAKIVEDKVYKDMHYDPNAYSDMLMTIENTDWDKTDAFGERDIPSYEDFVVGKMSEWVKAQGGTATRGKGVMRFKLPNSTEELVVTERQYDGPFSIKRKNPVTPGWNFAVRMFTDWMDAQHVNKVHSAVLAAKEETDNLVNTLVNKKNSLKAQYDTTKQLLDGAQKVDPERSLMEAVYKYRHYDEILGIYAALKGYDGIIADLGGKDRYVVVLNRSKLIMSSGIDNV